MQDNDKQYINNLLKEYLREAVPEDHNILPGLKIRLKRSQGWRNHFLLKTIWQYWDLYFKGDLTQSRGSKLPTLKFSRIGASALLFVVCTLLVCTAIWNFQQPTNNSSSGAVTSTNNLKDSTSAQPTVVAMAESASGEMALVEHPKSAYLPTPSPKNMKIIITIVDQQSTGIPCCLILHYHPKQT